MLEVPANGLQEDTQIYVCDINPNMLNVGKKRALERGMFKCLKWHRWMYSLYQPFKFNLSLF